jgi:hypothetical protein
LLSSLPVRSGSAREKEREKEREKGGREGWKHREREYVCERERWREGGREGGKHRERKRKRQRERWREGGREGWKQRERHREMIMHTYREIKKWMLERRGRSRGGEELKRRGGGQEDGESCHLSENPRYTEMYLRKQGREEVSQYAREQEREYASMRCGGSMGCGVCRGRLAHSRIDERLGHVHEAS